MSLHTWRRQGPHKPSSCTPFMLNPHWGRAATGKKSFVHACRVASVMSQCFAALWTVACQASLSGGSPGKNTGAHCPILGAIPFWSTLFPAALAATTPPEYLLLPEPLLVSMEYIRATDSSHKRKHTSSDSCGHWRQEHTGQGPDYTLSCPHSRSRNQQSVGGHPREVRWAATPSMGKDSDSSDSEKHLFFLCFDMFNRFFWIFFSFFPPLL